MSLDVFQNKQGVAAINPSFNYTVAASLSSIASNQYPGGLALGGIAGFLPGLATSGGGAVYMAGFPLATTTGSFGQSVTTGGTVFHNNAGLVGINATTTANNLQMQSPTVPGQLLFLQNCGTVSCSVGTIATVNNWSTTGTVTAQNLNAAFTLGVGSGVQLIASPFAVTTTGQWPLGLWKAVATNI